MERIFLPLPFPEDFEFHRLDLEDPEGLHDAGDEHPVPHPEKTLQVGLVEPDRRDRSASVGEFQFEEMHELAGRSSFAQGGHPPEKGRGFSGANVANRTDFSPVVMLPGVAGQEIEEGLDSRAGERLGPPGSHPFPVADGVEQVHFSSPGRFSSRRSSSRSFP